MAQTDEDWQAIVSSAQASIHQSNTSKATFPTEATGPISSYIDHTQLKLDATRALIDTLCQEALSSHFATVCVRQNHVSRVHAALKGSDVGIACVIGFHEGTYPTEEKVAEAKRAIEGGASELDIVMNWGWLKAGRYADVYQELESIRKVAKEPVLVKVILETSQLSEEEVVAGVVVAGYAGADFVKTSTGFCGRGASLEDVRLMGAVVDWLESKGVGRRDADGGLRKIRIKAAGGISNFADAVKMVEAGANRIGTSSGLAIVEGERDVTKATGKSVEEAAQTSNGTNDY